jgi:hypothetical protein
MRASIAQLEKAFTAAVASGPIGQPTFGQAPSADANAYVRFAVAAVRSNDFAAAVVVLQGTVRLPGVTPEEFMAIDQARKALMNDLLIRATRGDAEAQAALKTIEQARSH